MLRHPRRYQGFIPECDGDGDSGSPRTTRREGGYLAARNSDSEDDTSAARRREFELHCRNQVDMMGEEAEEWHMMALSRVMRVPIEIESIGNGDQPYHRRLWEEDDCFSSPQSQLPASNRKACLLYLPGHYEIIYPAAACN